MKRFSCTFPIPGGATLAAGLLLALTHPVNAAEVHGTLGADTTWTAADSPYLLTAPVTVAAGVTLRVEPGAVVHFSKGVDLVITNGARMLAEGTAEKRIRFSRPPGRRERWGGIVIAGAVDSPETRLTHVHIEGNDFSAIYSAHGTLFLDQVTFGTRDRQFMSLDGSSFLVQHCHFHWLWFRPEDVYFSMALSWHARNTVPPE